MPEDDDTGPSHYLTIPFARRLSVAGNAHVPGIMAGAGRWESMFEELEKINARPEPFAFYTARDLWDDEHTSRQMLSFHLDEEIDVSSRNTRFIDQSVDWIASRFRIRPETKMADFGCGPGLYAERLALKRITVTGIDFSRRSIEYARKSAIGKGLSIRYVHQDYLAFETEERFDVILMIMCDFCALSPVQRRKMLIKFRKMLAPTGSVLLDVYSERAFGKRQEAAIYERQLLSGFWSSNPYFGFLNTFKYLSEKVVLDQYTIVEADRIRTVYNWLKYFTPEEIEKECTDCGLMIESLYSDVRGTPFDRQSDEFAVVARKGSLR